jgi:hypothetical protein
MELTHNLKKTEGRKHGEKVLLKVNKLAGTVG